MTPTRRIQLLVLILLTLLLPLCLSEASEPQESVQELVSPVPEELGGLTLVIHKTGDAAMRELSIMHGGSGKLILLDAHTAYYGSDSQIILWVGGVGSEEEAQRLLEDMNTGMGSSGVFTKPQLHRISGQAVYFVTGIGMSNYYFASGREVVWVATKNPDPAYGDALVLQLIEGR